MSAGFRRLLVDTAVLAYALGDTHPLRGPCQGIVAAAGRGELQLHASVEMVQELLFHRLRRVERRLAVQQAREAAELCIVHDFGQPVLQRALDLIEGGSIRGRDAVHAATALENGLTEVLSPDQAFDDVPGLTRIDPADWA